MKRSMRGVAINGGAFVAARQRCGLTQEQLARKADLDVKTIRKAEKNQSQFDLRTIIRMAEALGCAVRQISPVLDESGDLASVNQQVVLRWHETFVAANLEAHLMLYTNDTILETPAAEGLPWAGNLRGIESLKQHLQKTFQLFRIVDVRQDELLIHSDADYVFLRTTETIEYRPLTRTYTSRFSNEFLLRDGLIARRVVFADYEHLRKAMKPSTAVTAD